MHTYSPLQLAGQPLICHDLLLAVNFEMLPILVRGYKETAVVEEDESLLPCNLSPPLKELCYHKLK